MKQCIVEFAASKTNARSHHLRYRDYLENLVQFPMKRVDMYICEIRVHRVDVPMRARSSKYGSNRNSKPITLHMQSYLRDDVK